MDVAVVGYLAIDTIVCPVGRYEGVPGGGAYYCAAAAAASGATVGLVATVGHDFPQEALDDLVKLGVELFIEWSDAPSPRSRLFDPAGSSRVTPHHRDPDWLAAQFRLQPPFACLDAKVSVFMAQPSESLAAQISARKGSSMLMADTGTSYASMETEVLQGLVRQLDVFAPSREESRLLYPGLGDDEALAAMAADIPLVIQKRGPDGLFLVRERGDVIHQSTHVRSLTDPTGAGDSVVGSVAAGLAQNRSDREILRRASELAAWCVGDVGIAGLKSAAAAKALID